ALSNRCGATWARAGYRGVASASRWFIEEEALAHWRPERRAAGRVGEAVATYEATIMKTDKTKKRDRLIDEELLREIDEIAERIREEAGEIDVVELIRQDREEH